jgi:ribosome-binding factor A
MIPQRQNRVSELIKREISIVLQQEMQDPRIGFVTVTKVIITQDLKHAKVLVSILGDDSAKKTSMEAINNSLGKIKELLASRIKLRYMPTIQFQLDTSIEYSAHINDLLARLKKEEGWDEEKQ